ncbi:hypothetical protein BV22DRAFT_1039773 [Leucogyrophana mollusca]|uniref:Uncharacterized protein n=1 Tax=Leucogyrophana mollusca TaxID=85980 RepID=A0ACB8B4N2_9AGAM|nr:hypothetical protein BV22DRAFT_1039773 [Leucogyrophana mollusca]
MISKRYNDTLLQKGTQAAGPTILVGYGCLRLDLVEELGPLRMVPLKRIFPQRNWSQLLSSNL